MPGGVRGRAGLGKRGRNLDSGAAVQHTLLIVLGSYAMKGGLMWLLGIPIPIIILLYLFHVI